MKRILLSLMLVALAVPAMAQYDLHTTGVNADSALRRALDFLPVGPLSGTLKGNGMGAFTAVASETTGHAAAMALKANLTAVLKNADSTGTLHRSDTTGAMIITAAELEARITAAALGGGGILDSVRAGFGVTSTRTNDSVVTVAVNPTAIGTQIADSAMVVELGTGWSISAINATEDTLRRVTLGGTMTMSGVTLNADTGVVATRSWVLGRGYGTGTGSAGPSLPSDRYDSSAIVVGRVRTLVIGNNERIDSVKVMFAGASADFRFNVFSGTTIGTATDSLFSSNWNVTGSNTVATRTISTMRDSGWLGSKYWWVTFNAAATKPSDLTIQFWAHRTSSAPATPDTTYLINWVTPTANGGFETAGSPTFGTWVEWKDAGSTVIDTTGGAAVHSGSYAARMYHPTGAENLCDLLQDVLSLGVSYTASYWAKGTAEGSAMILYFGDGDYHYQALSTTWTKYDVTGTCTTNTYFKLHCVSGGGIIVDDVKLYVTP